MALYPEEINGGHLILMIYDNGAWSPLAYGTSHSIEQTVETREVSNKNYCGTKKILASRIGFSGSADGMNDYTGAGFTELAKIQAKREPIYIASDPNPCAQNSFGDAVDDYENYEVWWGQALITSLSAEYPDEDNSTYSLSFEGIGDLTFSAPKPPIPA